MLFAHSYNYKRRKNVWYKRYIFPVGNETVKIQTGEVARQAGGSVMVTKGKTTILVTAARSKDVKEVKISFH